MSNTFKPGDRVRRTGVSRPSEGMIQGEEYVVTETSASGNLWVPGIPYSYDHLLFELVEPAPAEFKAGDRVRATAKEGDDTAEFTVVAVGHEYLESDLHYFENVDWGFEVITPPKPTPQEVWDSFPIGQRFHFGDVDPTYEKVKVTAEKFYDPRVDNVDYVEPYLPLGIVPIND